MPKKKRPASSRGRSKGTSHRAKPALPRMPVAGRLGPRSAEEEIHNAMRAGRPLVTLLDREGEIGSLPASADYQAVVDRWSRILQSRRSWADRQATRDAQASNALKELKQLGLAKDQMQRASMADHIEVRIHDADSRGSAGDHYSMLYAQRVPWEYLLSAGTAALGRQQPMSISRHLAGAVPTTATIARTPRSLLYLQSVPGQLGKDFDFSSEQRVVCSTLGFGETATTSLINPKLHELQTTVQKQPPDVIHIAGIDVHQARALLGPKSALDDSHDGLPILGPQGQVMALHGGDLAQALVSAGAAPLLISFNLYHSAAELAAEAVARGAGAAIGFQDEIDDQTAEYFFAELYRTWRQKNWNLLEAFGGAWRSLRGSIAHLHGSGIVLWSDTSVFALPARSGAVEAGAPVAGKRRGRSGASRRLPEPASAAVAAPAREDVIVSVEIEPEINYGLLHNGLPVFRKLTLHKPAAGPALPVEVTVELNVGSDSYPYRHTVTLEEQPVALAEKVRVPLTSSLARALRERVQSTLYLCVKAGDTVIYQRTVGVTLLPVDEWLDDGKQSVWLPSFVLPRDPVIGRIVDAAQRYLMALQDDPAAGFDGYQALDPADPDTRTMVDLQVRALWCALSYDFGLSYINPPPSYSARTQRLRTPSDVINGRRGTCIDLALLLAACLEYVDIYPAVILLKGHAFPAFWRSDAAHDDFVLANAGPAATGAGNDPSAGVPAGVKGQVGRYGWQFQRQHFSLLMQCIQRGDLVPLETVDLTNRSSFDTAMQDGLENLRNKSEFDSLLDLVQARRNEPPVTPLPIIQNNQ